MSAPTAYTWPAAAPRCRQCKKNDRPHYGRGLCGACYQWFERRGLLDQFALLPVHGNLGTDSWVASPRHLIVYRNHKRLKKAAWERQRRIWNTDGPLIDPASCEVLTTPPPRTRFPAHGSGEERQAAA